MMATLLMASRSTGACCPHPCHTVVRASRVRHVSCLPSWAGAGPVDSRSRSTIGSRMVRASGRVLDAVQRRGQVLHRQAAHLRLLLGDGGE